jgi:hemoglobin
MQSDIKTLADVHQLVHTFYGLIREEPLLGPVFEERIQDNWPEHLEKMVRFWQTVLLEERTYFGSPFPPHASLPVQPVHFERWIQVFEQTVDHLFEGENAQKAKLQGGRMAALFQAKHAYYQDNKSIPLV